MATDDQGGTALQGTATVAIASILFGTIGLFVHALRDLPFPALVGYRYGFGALAFVLTFLLVPAWRRAARPERAHLPFLVALGVVLVTIEVLFFTAILAIGMGLATILLATAPVYVALGEWALLREPPGRRAWGGIVLGFAGVLLIVGPDAWTDGSVDLGLVAGAASGVMWATWLLLSRAAGTRGATGEAQALGGLLTAAALTVPVALALAPVVPSPQGLASAVALGAVGGGLGILLFNRGLRHVTAARAAVIAYLEPLTAVVLGTLFLGEAFGAWQAGGSLLVLLGTALVTVRPPPRHPASPRSA